MSIDVVDPGLRGSVRHAPAADPARPGRHLRGQPVDDRRRLPDRARQDARSRPRRGHQLPADRRHARRAEGQAAAAEHGRHGHRRGVRPVGGARSAARPAPRGQDLQGRRHGVRPAGRGRRLQLPPSRRPRRAVRRRHARHARGHEPDPAAQRRHLGADPAPDPDGRPVPRQPDHHDGGRRGRRTASTNCPASGASRSAGSPAISSTASR